MKKSIVFYLLLCFAGQLVAQHDAINKYFDQYINHEDFTSVYVSPKLIEIVSDIDIAALDDGDIATNEAAMIEEVLNQLKGVMLLRTDSKPLVYYKQIFKDFTKDHAGYELLLSVNDKGNQVKMWTQTEGNVIQELVMLVGGTSEMIMLSLTGNIDLKKISRLAGNIEVAGIEYLEHLDKKERKPKEQSQNQNQP